MSENEKDKEIKKTSETESYEDYEGEAMENAEEGSGLEEVSQDNLLADICQVAGHISVSENEDHFGGESFHDAYEERKRLLLMEKWLTVTGKKPRNIPTVRKPLDETPEKFVCFGDRRPGEVEKQIRQRLLAASVEIQKNASKFGKVRQEILLPALFSGLLCIKFDPIGENMATSDRQGGVQIRKSTTGEVLLNLKTREANEQLPMRTLRYTQYHPKKLYVAGDTGMIQVFQTLTGELLGAGEPLNVINNMDISPDGRSLATAGREGKVCVVDAYTLQVVSVRMWPGKDEIIHPRVYDEYHRQRVYGIKFHPTETNVFATGGVDGTVKIWDIRTPTAIRSISGPPIYGDGVDLEGKTILTASWKAEESLNLWDFTSGRLIKNIPIKSKFTKYEGEFLYTCHFFRDDPAHSWITSDLAAVGGSGFTDVIVINILTDEVVRHFPSLKPILCLEIHENLIAYGGKESVYRIAELEMKDRGYTSRH